jgi:hypothetical protein
MLGILKKSPGNFGVAAYSSVRSVIEGTKAMIAKDRVFRHRRGIEGSDKHESRADLTRPLMGDPFTTIRQPLQQAAIARWRLSSPSIPFPP